MLSGAPGLLALAGATITFALAAGAPAPAEAAALPSPLADATDVAQAPVLGDPAALLRAGLAARAAGEDETAVRWLAEVVKRHAIVADHAALIQAGWLLADGEAEAAAAVARSALRNEPGARTTPRLQALLGDALAALGDYAAAETAWRTALDLSRDGALRARVLLAIAAAEERRGLDEAAATTYELLWSSHPSREEGRLASQRLDQLEQSFGRPLRTGRDWHERGDRLFGESRNEDALAAYQRAETLGLSPAELARTRQQIAHTLFRMRRYPDALEAFEALPQSDDTKIWRARSMARAGQVMESIEELERLAETTRGAESVRARFLAALLLDGRGYHERAQAHYQLVSKSSRGAALGDAADWRLGWAAYRQGELDRALVYFERLMKRTRGDELERLRPRYWRARVLERQGDARAQTEFARLALEHPLSYYGWRAQARVDAASAASAAPPRRPPSDVPGRLPASALDRPRILLEAGLTAEARGEIELVASRARGVRERLALAQLATEAGDFHRAQRLVVDAFAETLSRGPQAGYEELWWYAWPAAFAPLVDEATRAPGAVERALVFAIMREESGYRAGVMSPVGARGLLQIMPPTGERLAQTVGLSPFDPEDLFDPGVNVRLGSHYLGELTAQFEGRLSAAIASYNAGPEAVAEWPLGELADDDEWVESIPYDETRTYVRRVLQSLHAYRVLY